MGFFSRLGNKISSAYNKGSRLGHKALGTASRIGHKISAVGHTVVDTKIKHLQFHYYISSSDKHKIRTQYSTFSITDTSTLFTCYF